MSERLDLTKLRRIAVAADKDGRPWVWRASEAEARGGYPQHVLREGDVGLICETYDEPDHPAITPEFIATFDPPTVLALLEIGELPDGPAPVDSAGGGRRGDHERRGPEMTASQRMRLPAGAAV